jgi:hypothetical protein
VGRLTLTNDDTQKEYEQRWTQAEGYKSRIAAQQVAGHGGALACTGLIGNIPGLRAGTGWRRS